MAWRGGRPACSMSLSLCGRDVNVVEAPAHANIRAVCGTLPGARAVMAGIRVHACTPDKYAHSPDVPRRTFFTEQLPPADSALLFLPPFLFGHLLGRLLSSRLLLLWYRKPQRTRIPVTSSRLKVAPAVLPAGSFFARRLRSCCWFAKRGKKATQWRLERKEQGRKERQDNAVASCLARASTSHRNGTGHPLTLRLAFDLRIFEGRSDTEVAGFQEHRYNTWQPMLILHFLLPLLWRICTLKRHTPARHENAGVPRL